MIEWTIPIITVSEANSSEFWKVKSDRHKQQQFFIKLSYKKYVKKIILPCSITLTRLSPRLLDEDNLVSAFKYIRDEISECIFPEKTGMYMTKKGKWKKLKGRADSDPRIKWNYRQEKNFISQVKIEIDFDTSLKQAYIDHV